MKKKKPFAAFLLVSLLIVAGATTAWAASAWASKPWTDWSEHDITKILSDSPWARAASTIPAFARFPAPPAIAVPTESEGGRGSAQSVVPSGDIHIAAIKVVFVRWQSSVVIQEALVKAQYGNKAATSPEAQKRLASNNAYYLIAVANLGDGFEPAGPEAKASLLAATTLTAKDKSPIVAEDVLFVQSAAAATEARFLFHRNAGFSVEDKYADFATKFGKQSVVKARFNLREMVVGGRLEL